MWTESLSNNINGGEKLYHLARGPGISTDCRNQRDPAQVGVSQKQAKPLDADALAAIRATALNPRRSRGGSLESEETALRRGRLDIALASGHV